MFIIQNNIDTIMLFTPMNINDDGEYWTSSGCISLGFLGILGIGVWRWLLEPMKIDHATGTDDLLEVRTNVPYIFGLFFRAMYSMI